jgi:phosphatidylglycerophosphatase A
MTSAAEPRDSTDDWLSRVCVWLATGFGVGRFPWAPGTLGAAEGLVWMWIVSRLPGAGPQALAIVGLVALGVPICTRAARRLDHKDPGAIVLDEIASLPLVLWQMPLDRPLVWAAGFALHRLFDVAKPPPIRQIERLPAGLGIMADDLLAAVYAHLALRGLLWLEVV